MPTPIEYLILHNKRWSIVHVGTAAAVDDANKKRIAWWCAADGSCVCPVGREDRLFDLDELEASDV